MSEIMDERERWHAVLSDCWESHILEDAIISTTLVVNLLTDYLENHPECERLIDAIGSSKHPYAVHLICDLYADAIHRQKVLECAKENLKYMTYHNAEILLLYLQHSKESARIAICEFLAETPKQEALSTLLALLDDPVRRVQYSAIKALEALEMYDAAPRLLEYWRKQSSEYYLVGTAIWKTGNMDIILEAIRDPNPIIRSQMATIGFRGYLRHPLALSVFLQNLSDNDWWVRRFAIDYIGILGDKSEYPDVLQLRADPELQVRRSVITALIRIANFEALPDVFSFVYDESRDVRFTLFYEVSGINHPAVLPILEILATDIDLNVRFNAENALKKRLSKQGT